MLKLSCDIFRRRSGFYLALSYECRIRSVVIWGIFKRKQGGKRFFTNHKLFIS